MATLKELRALLQKPAPEPVAEQPKTLSMNNVTININGETYPLTGKAELSFLEKKSKPIVTEEEAKAVVIDSVGFNLDDVKNPKVVGFGAAGQVDRFLPAKEVGKNRYELDPESCTRPVVHAFQSIECVLYKGESLVVEPPDFKHTLTLR
jgi:hypothetical protein